MSIFPNVIKVIIIDGDTGNSLSNIVLGIHLYASRKNDYNFTLPLSDKNGTILISKEWLINQVNIQKELAIMDYSSDLEDCLPKLKFDVLNTKEIKNVLYAWSLYKIYLGIKQENIDALLKAENYLYTPMTKIIELTGEKKIEVNLPLYKVNR